MTSIHRRLRFNKKRDMCIQYYSLELERRFVPVVPAVHVVPVV